jgi:hypothetical protein
MSQDEHVRRRVSQTGLPSRPVHSIRSKKARLRPAVAGLRRNSLRSRLTTRAKTGGKGIRTPGLLIANETLYQLSYTPKYR